MKKAVRVVVIFTDDTQMPCDIDIEQGKSLETYLNKAGNFIECRNVTLKGAERPLFLLNTINTKGIVPIE